MLCNKFGNLIRNAPLLNLVKVYRLHPLQLVRDRTRSFFSRNGCLDRLSRHAWQLGKLQQQLQLPLPVAVSPSSVPTFIVKMALLQDRMRHLKHGTDLSNGLILKQTLHTLLQLSPYLCCKYIHLLKYFCGNV